MAIAFALGSYAAGSRNSSDASCIRNVEADRHRRDAQPAAVAAATPGTYGARESYTCRPRNLTIVTLASAMSIDDQTKTMRAARQEVSQRVADVDAGGRKERNSGCGSRVCRTVPTDRRRCADRRCARSNRSQVQRTLARRNAPARGVARLRTRSGVAAATPRPIFQRLRTYRVHIPPGANAAPACGRYDSMNGRSPCRPARGAAATGPGS